MSERRKIAAPSSTRNEASKDSLFKIPNWATRPPEGYHLDVIKCDKLMQKLLIDEKKAYFFGRSADNCDIVVDHASCSRVHAVLVYHKVLKIPFLIDLSSTHGTFINGVRLEAEKPEPLNFDKPFRFGASTRTYVLREKPPSADVDVGQTSAEAADLPSADGAEGITALDRLTEYHTALNRRVLDIHSTMQPVRSACKPRKRVAFDLTEEIINPEDIDPSIGKFRNLVQTSVLFTKKRKYQTDATGAAGSAAVGHGNVVHPEGGVIPGKSSSSLPFPSSTFSVADVDIAPDTSMGPMKLPPARRVKGLTRPLNAESEDLMSISKKKYPTEAWPGKYPNLHLLV